MSERLEAINRWFAELVPHNRALSMRAIAIEDRGILSELPYDPRLVGDPETGVLHGGAITALVDATCGMSVVVALEQPQRIATLDLRIDYLRPAEPGRAVQCRAECYRIARRVAFVRALAHHGDESESIAAAAGTFIRLGSWSDGGSGRREDQGSWPMSAVLEAIRAAREAGDFSALIAQVPYAQFLGLDIHIIDGCVVGTMRFADHLIGNAAVPALHGGTLGALLESTAIFTVLWEAESATVPKTVNITVEYLRTGRPVDTYARAVVTRQGRRVANVRATAWQDDADRPIAAANAHFLV